MSVTTPARPTSHHLRLVIQVFSEGKQMMVHPLGGPAFWWPLLAAFVVGYLAGSIPFGLLLTRAAGAGDIRRIGSGNIGATNVLRTGRKGLALATLVADIAKGALPVWLGYRWFGPDLAVLAGAGAILGHCFPVWLGFRGGKGVATAAGVILGLTPVVLLPTLAVFIVVVWASGFVSLGSLLAAIAAPLCAWLLGYPQAAELYLLIAAIVFIKHAGNIRRLVVGKESKVSLGRGKS
jgi:glycerol-3-phosphate acyltransferase PlsY